MSQLSTRPLGATGLHVSPLGFGAAPVGYLGESQDTIAALLHAVLDAGVNLIDTAACYPGSEEAIGRAVASRRDAYVLVSKCGHASGLPTPDWAPATIAASIDRSLQRLRTDRIDVMLLHSCGLETLQQGDALAALLKARDAGKIRHAGYSGDNQAAAWAAAQPDLAVIETSVSIADQHNIDAVLPVCRRHARGVLAKRPIANACWKSPDQQRGIYRDYAGEYRRRFEAMKLDPAALGFTAADWPAVALRFTLAIEGVHCAIVGTTRRASLAANLDAAARGPLDSRLVQAFRDAFARAQAAEDGAWLGQT